MIPIDFAERFEVVEVTKNIEERVDLRSLKEIPSDYFDNVPALICEIPNMTDENKKVETNYGKAVYSYDVYDNKNDNFIKTGMTLAQLVTFIVESTKE
ncbi:hypothetical protein [Liquorilactobacillus hordei]|uniref:Uncharacterized protein n=1 Tax=Liquorilactobacillus hordei DSM 19519 TaxID=1423759 RepID=A0A0R1MFP2_9LACO|nr:hypothetical protein [Liquorilactobacillus hordei]KRL03882.1 hypothetical protein FC92_GL001947 [Liquorilactobacillus hordei DSM 19519]QYH51417.1 hypothetical protein G6O70_02480 [Liquorilactobacillus hordei DSM 19519]